MGTTTVTRAGNSDSVTQEWQKTVVYGSGNYSLIAQEVRDALHISGSRGLVYDAAGGGLTNGSTGAKNVVDLSGNVNATRTTEVRFKNARRLENKINIHSDISHAAWTKLNLTVVAADKNVEFIDYDGSTVSGSLSKLTCTGGLAQHKISSTLVTANTWIRAVVDLSGLATKKIYLIPINSAAIRVQIEFTASDALTITDTGSVSYYKIIGPYQAVIYSYCAGPQDSFQVWVGNWGNYSNDGGYAHVGLLASSPASALHIWPVEFIDGFVTSYNAGCAGVKYFTNYDRYTGIHFWGDSMIGAGSPGIVTRAANLHHTAYNGGVGGETSTQVKTRMVADTNHLNRIQVIWAGRNNYTDSATVLADIAEMVAKIPHNNYVILGVCNGEYTIEYNTGAWYHYFSDINDELATTYPNNFIDIRTILVNAYNPILAQDVIDFDHDIIPYSLRYDNVHTNAAGSSIVYNALVSFMESHNMIPRNIITNSAIVHEPATSNLALLPRDLTNAAYVKTNCTAAKTATGTDGVANAASTLTATAANATCLQTITSASANRVTGAFIKRRTGAGVINMTQDNGTTWTPVTVPAAWGSTPLVIPAATVANPVIGFQIVTSGDAIDIDWVQHELGAYITSPISGSRTIDSIKVPLSANVNFPQAKGIAFVKVTPQFANSATAKSLLCTNSAATDFIHDNGSGEIAINDGTNTATTSGLGGWTTGDVLSIIACWVTDTMSIHVKKNDGAWIDSANATYDGAFPVGANFLLCNGNTDTVLINAIRIKNTTRILSHAQEWAKNAFVYEAL